MRMRMRRAQPEKGRPTLSKPPSSSSSQVGGVGAGSPWSLLRGEGGRERWRVEESVGVVVMDASAAFLGELLRPHAAASDQRRDGGREWRGSGRIEAALFFSGGMTCW